MTNKEAPENEQAGWNGGFDVVLGNPPWEKINFKDVEFFAVSHPHIANAPNKAERKKMLAELEEHDPTAFARYEEAKQMQDRISIYFRHSGYFPLTGVSRINLYSVFCETAVRHVSSRGRFGFVLASGILTDENNKAIFSLLIDDQRLISAWDFENRDGIFPDVHSSYKFCILCGAGTDIRHSVTDFAFYLTAVEQLSEQDRHFTLSAIDLRLLNPNSRTCPTFRNRHEAEATKAIYRRVQAWALHAKSAIWPGTPKTPFNMSNDAGLFLDLNKLEELRRASVSVLPVYESKFIHQFNHRFATFTHACDDSATELSNKQLNNASQLVTSRYWLPKSILDERYPGRWFLVYRMITCATNERTSVAAVIPEVPCGNSLTIIADVSAPKATALDGVLNSFVYDYCARQKVAGTNFNHWIWHQLPVPSEYTLDVPHKWAGADSLLSSNSSFVNWLLPRVLELTNTAWDLEAFSRDCGYTGPPFRWDEDRRFLIRAELDAAFFHLYLPTDENGDWVPARQSDGCPYDESPEDLARLKASFPKPRDSVSYIMDTFPIVRRKDEEKYNGDFRTKRVILEIYDSMQESIRTGRPYQTRLDPPPGPPTKPLPEWLPGSPRPANWPTHIHPPRGDEDD